MHTSSTLEPISNLILLTFGMTPGVAGKGPHSTNEMKLAFNGAQHTMYKQVKQASTQSFGTYHTCANAYNKC